MDERMSSRSIVLRDVPSPGPPVVRLPAHGTLVCTLSPGRSRVLRSVQKWHVCDCAVAARCGVHPPCLGRPGGDCCA